MLKQNIIKPFSRPWNSPVWVVPEKPDAAGNKWRIVIDYRKLNNITIGEAYPLPLINELLDNLGHSKYFTALTMFIKSRLAFHYTVILKLIVCLLVYDRRPRAFRNL